MKAYYKRSFTRVGGQGVVTGSGHVAERIVALPRMSRVCIGSGFQAALTVERHHRGDMSLRIRADDNVMPFVVAKTQAGAIFVGLRNGAFTDLAELSVTATVGPLSEISAINAASVIVHNVEGEAVALRADNGSRLVAAGRAQRWTLHLASASRGNLTFGEAEAIHVQLASRSYLSLEGSAADTKIEASAASTLLATRPAFVTRRAHVNLSGISNARLGVRGAVRGEVRGLSRLLVAGEAVIDVKGAANRE